MSEKQTFTLWVIGMILTASLLFGMGSCCKDFAIKDKTHTHEMESKGFYKIATDRGDIWIPIEGGK